MNYKYFCLDNDETIEDARDVYYDRMNTATMAMEPVRDHAPDIHKALASAAARDRYARSRPDWNSGTRTIVIVDENGVAKTFEVELDYEPTFSIVEKK